MKVYSIATVKNECYGHGDYGIEEKICRLGGYGEGEGEFPPVFTKRSDAEHYRLGMFFPEGTRVVELDLL